jgi:GNAT superfamily N-acetyltransferase
VPKLSHALVNDVFRGPVYGPHDIFTARSFDDFVRRNDVDLSRALFAHDGDRVIGTICFAQRGERAWLSLMGVLPEYRRNGCGRRLFGGAVDSVIASGATAMEFEVLQRNVAAQAMYKSFGFETVGELFVWSRKARRVAVNALAPRKHPIETVRRIAHSPPACWQRAPVAVARAAASVAIEVEGGYAFVRVRDESAYVLDAGARDETSAAALLREFDARIPYEVTLFNEPAGSPLSRALANGGWKIVERQFRMMRATP